MHLSGFCFVRVRLRVLLCRQKPRPGSVRNLDACCQSRAPSSHTSESFVPSSTVSAISQHQQLDSSSTMQQQQQRRRKPLGQLCTNTGLSPSRGAWGNLPLARLLAGQGPEKQAAGLGRRLVIKPKAKPASLQTELGCMLIIR